MNQLEEVKSEDENDEDDDKYVIDVLKKAKDFEEAVKAKVDEFKVVEKKEPKKGEKAKKKPEAKPKTSNLYDTICHSFFIAKDNVDINWRSPYVQSSTVKCRVRI